MSNFNNAPDDNNGNDLDGYIRPRVYKALSTISSNSTSIMHDNVDLKYHLYLTSMHLRNLRRPFQEILTSLNSEAMITSEECERLGRVKDCIDLIKRKTV